MKNSTNKAMEQEVPRCSDCGAEEIVKDSVYLIPLCQDCLNERDEYTSEIISEQAKKGVFVKEGSAPPQEQ